MRVTIETTSGKVFEADNSYLYRNTPSLKYWISKVDPRFVCRVLRFENDGVVYEMWSVGTGYKTFESHALHFTSKWILDDNHSVHFPGRN